MEGLVPLQVISADILRFIRMKQHSGCRKENAHRQSECAERQLPPVEKHRPFVMKKQHYRSSALIHKYLNAIPLKSEDLYLRILRHRMCKSMMREYGYPIPDEEAPGKVTLFSNSMFAKPNNPSLQICRCGKQISLLDANWYADDAGCNYHLGKRVYCDGPQNGRFSCCSSAGPPCAHGLHHVSFHRPFRDIEFVRVSPEARGRRHSANVYALDCEMAFTTRGMELVRVSLIGIGGGVIYDTYVRPQHPILDYNTPFSGVREGDLSDITTTLSDVHDTLLSILDADSVLIGHSLENDFLALNLVHENVVDTAFLFPHERGYPYKNSLKHLAAVHLGKRIQEAFRGHDSVEDATTCMELLLHKIYVDTLTPPVLVMQPPPPQLYMAPPLMIVEGQWMAMGSNRNAPIRNVCKGNAIAKSKGNVISQSITGKNGKAGAQINASINGKGTAQKCTSNNGKVTSQKITSINGKGTAQNSTNNNAKAPAQNVGTTNPQNSPCTYANATAKNSASEVVNGASQKAISQAGSANITDKNPLSNAENATTNNEKGTAKTADGNEKNTTAKTAPKCQSGEAKVNSPSMTVSSSADDAGTVSKNEGKVPESSNGKVAFKDDVIIKKRSPTPNNSSDIACKNPWLMLPVNKGNMVVCNAPNNGYKRITVPPPPRPYYGAFKNPCPPTFFNGPICPPFLPFFSPGFFVPNNLIRWC